MKFKYTHLKLIDWEEDDPTYCKKLLLLTGTSLASMKATK